ncbi:diacylglycerol lipase-beta-like [Lycorma delicatula]|uniref:diacylglycerol lipase-beta-like n=1 Tax=Lycorma delicatula TaxID=130591 RepID=UPI003F517290
MPALKLFGRKWLAGSDDLVFPGLFEIILRSVWLALMGVVTSRYYNYTYTCTFGGDFVRVYLIGMIILLSVVNVVLILLVSQSARGSIVDVHARRHVPTILAIKLFLILPEVGWNVLGTIWAFTTVIECPNNDHFTNTVIDILVCCDWVLFALAVFGIAMVMDPIGSVKLRGSQPDISLDTLKHRKVTRIWVRRFRWFFCWLIRDKQSHEAFTQVAGLCSSMFRDSDLVPSDIVAGCVLLRVKQKRESREQRRLELVAEQRLKYTSDVKEAFQGTPSWMNLETACHYMKLSIASYGCHFVLFQHCVTGVFKLLRYMTCCACLRNKKTVVKDDNCCLCSLAGVKYSSKLAEDDILYANFRNRLYELPFCVIADHKTKSVVITIRGSMSLRDIFTDLTGVPEKLEVEGVPEDSMAHKGMLMCAVRLKKHIEDMGILDKTFAMYPTYNLVLTGHSLGAGVSILLGLLLRPVYPDIKVFAFATPSGLLSLEAARYTENFVLSIGVGDDFAMRLSIDSFEDLRNQLFIVLQACRLPKYRVMVNGFGYFLFGVPSRDLESTWRSDRPSPSHRHRVLLPAQNASPYVYADVANRKFTKIKMYTAGKILHIAYKKKVKGDKKSTNSGDTFEMRWMAPEELLELRVMPRMFKDHLPHNILKTIETVLSEQRTEIVEFTEITII